MEFSKASLTPYLRHKLGPACEVVEVEKFGRGTSRETWFVTCAGGQGEARHLVFRRDPATGSVDFSPLNQEHFIYERLGRTAVPVARVLWWEDDPAWTDRPFYVREHVAGSWDIPHFKDPSPEYDDLRMRISQEHMRKLALVHAVDWRALELNAVLGTAPDTASAAHHYLDSVLALIESQRIEPIPIVLEAVEWLKERAPAASRITLCKGTNGLGEEIFANGEIVAMSDWEEAHIGDPAADFAFLQEFTPTIVRDGKVLWDLEKALDYYRSVGGAPVSAASVQYYYMVRALRMLAFSHRAGASVHRSPATPIRQAWTGTEVLHFSKLLLAHAMGLVPAPDPSYFAELNTSVENAP
ncbi:phosphotransferase family protein [Paraburkholderia unamae]|uniref:Aminoglycoside phosphotransferase (APT) family kinase protein n=1 Tax=Paraburkholderia unamae TaxID=219649 RepID=A0ABX5KG26_9BURK|nr:phosphotransferase family protein [Paraburkholderia unamae]PVX75696.1 aminoglycoside phosphotransferase (APT) family kinase protein [Paraburkholderia unamae]RAR57899.1 aminoglycoside phosphotransferase (APT) family kinase protein [Paraburkholderia unamae]